jgi:hypothetical protein
MKDQQTHERPRGTSHFSTPASGDFTIIPSGKDIEAGSQEQMKVV